MCNFGANHERHQAPNQCAKAKLHGKGGGDHCGTPAFTTATSAKVSANEVAEQEFDCVCGVCGTESTVSEGQLRACLRYAQRRDSSDDRDEGPAPERRERSQW